MKNFIEKTLAMFRRNPFIVVLISLCLILIAFILFSRGSSVEETGGDRASTTSDAFIVYKGSPFLPTGNVYADQQVRKDVAFYARKQYAEYDPEKNPAVLFTVKDYSRGDSGIVTFSGNFEKHSGKVTIIAQSLNNDRVKVSISSESDPVIDDTLPSASIENKYIASLPSETASYSISYSSEAKLYSVTVFNLSESTVKLAKDELRQKLSGDYSEDKVNVVYPAYLKGESSAAEAQSNFDPNLLEEVGDGGAPVGD